MLRWNDRGKAASALNDWGQFPTPADKTAPGPSSPFPASDHASELVGKAVESSRDFRRSR